MTRNQPAPAVDHDVLAGPTRGAIDLVAVDRVRRGHATPLTAAELAYLNTTLTGSAEEKRLIAAALGIGEDAVDRRLTRRRQRDRQRETSGP